jgi:hypothetical protein
MRCSFAGKHAGTRKIAFQQGDCAFANLVLRVTSETENYTVSETKVRK